MAVKHVQLGKNGPQVPALGFGLMGLSWQVYGSVPDDEEKFSILDRALEIGATFWDTADLYADSEQLVGRWLKRTGKRNEIFLATKFGLKITSQGYGVDSSAAYCKQQCDESLKRLGVDCIDLYYVHHADKVTPIEETMRALLDLQKQGKIKHIGLSMVSSATLRRAYKLGHVAAVQVEYNMFTTDVEDASGTNLLRTCRELGVAMVCSSPLGRGLLTSTFASGRPVGDERDMRVSAMPRFTAENRGQNTRMISQLQKLADEKGCTLTQMALAWLMKQGDDVIPIPGTKQLKYLEENWESLDRHLTADDEAAIRDFAKQTELAGGYLPPGHEDTAYADTPEET